MENVKRIYFKNTKNYFKCLLLREHEYYLYKFQSYLRHEECSKTILSKFIFRVLKNRLGTKLGLYIPAGVFDDGLHIWHYGNIIVNGESKVGARCILHGNNCIGNNGKEYGCPTIGDDVDIGVGAKIIGDIYIANGVKIGAGAIVVNSCFTENATLVGIPAKEINNTIIS